MKRLRTWVLALACAVGAIGPTNAWAVPELQIYIEGAEYIGETWVVESDTFTLWVVGNTGAKGKIDGVKLSAALPDRQSGSVTLTAIGGTPSAGTPTLETGIPLLGDGSALPAHGVYDENTSFFQWNLGDFTSTSDTIYDYTDVLGGSSTGQINKYLVTVSGLSSVHFDVYDHYYNKKGAQYTKAPFSHDGAGTSVPEPGTLLLLGSGLLGIGLVRGRKHKI